MLIKYIKNLLKHLLVGRHIFYPIWKRINELSLSGMNLGGGSYVCNSGELWLMRFLAKQLQNNPKIIIFDIGANVGDYTSAIISRFGKKVECYCFEPSKKTFDTLAENLSNNENIKSFNFGFGDKEESATLYSNEERSGLASIYRRHLEHIGINMKHEEEIRLRIMDNFCEEMGIHHIHLLKIDVEGHELKVLSGAHRLIDSNAIDFIQFEFGGCNIDSRTYFQDFFYLLNPHYRIYRILIDGLATIDNYKETCEIFITTNYLAVSRKLRFIK